MDLAYVDKLAKAKNGVNYLLVRQDLFDRIVDAKGRKTKDKRFQGNVSCIFDYHYKEESTQKYLGWKWNRSCWGYRKTMQSWMNTNLFYNEWDQVCICWTYKTMPEKYTLLLHGRQWIQVHSQFNSIFYNTKFQKKLLDWLDTKECKNSEILFILYSKTLRAFRKPKFKIGDRARTSKYDFSFKKGYKPQFTQEVFKIVATSFEKPLTYTKKDELDGIIRGKFYQNLIKVI